MKLTKGKLSKLYNKKKQSYKGKRYFKSNKNVKNSTFRNNTNLNLSSKTLKNLFPKKTKSGSHGLSKYRLYGGQANPEANPELPIENVQEKRVEEPSLALENENAKMDSPSVEPVTTENKEMVAQEQEQEPLVTTENKEMVAQEQEQEQEKEPLVTTESSPTVEQVTTENKEMVNPNIEGSQIETPKVDENGQPIKEAPVVDENGQPIKEAPPVEETGEQKPEQEMPLDENKEQDQSLDANGEPNKPEGQDQQFDENQEEQGQEEQDQGEQDQEEQDQEEQEQPFDENQQEQGQQFDENDEQNQPEGQNQQPDETGQNDQQPSTSDLPSNVANSVVALVDYIASAVAKKMSNSSTSSEGMQNGFDAVSEQANIENTSGGKRQRHTIKNRKQPKNKTR